LVGGSGYFDGSDYLSVPDNVAFTMGAGDFCLEAWVYVTAASGSQMIFGTCDSGGTQASMSFVLQAQNSSGFPSVGVGYAGAMYFATSPEALVKNQWNHIAGVRNGATVTIYVNGISRGTLNMATLPITDSAQIVGIGRNGNGNFEYLTGYIASARIVKGSPVYTANFTPPTTPLTAITNTQLLCNFTNAGIIDNTSDNVLETVGNAQISTVQSKWGGSSMYFNGSSGFLKFPPSQNFNFGGGDFTVEFWVYRVGAGSSGSDRIFQTADGDVFTAMSVFDSGGTVNFYYSTSGSSWGTAVIGTISNAWSHIAITRSGANLRTFLNGVNTSTNSLGTSALFFSATQTPIIGGQTGNRFFNGYIDDFRITKGVARYVANFTPPTSQLQDQ
jgi:hypothetical protein